MKRIQFKCTLLSDVILSINAATEGKQESLDFIPGGCFLGIAASSLYKGGGLSAAESLLVFHSGKVRFGDAHPIEREADKAIRTERIPAAYFHDKLKKEAEGCIINYEWMDDFTSQMKQCRNGFYTFDCTDKTCKRVETAKSVSIKSAYDRDNRRSKDEAMYSYEALNKGAEFVFEIEIDDEAENLESAVVQSLTGIRHIGRSKTAQYGLIEISQLDFIQCKSESAKGDRATVYADGRLIFINCNGIPTFKPLAQDLGFAPEAEIEWERSQIRTFQYAPWNAKRQNRDCDRCGIEKGSVIVVNLHGTQSPQETAYVGFYNNEGFGRIIYNPEFLSTRPGTNAETLFSIIESESSKSDAAEKPAATEKSRFNGALLNKLEEFKKADSEERSVYELVNGYVSKHKDEFRRGGERFASQWGHIRELANTSKDKSDFYKKVKGYLGHGVAEEKWRYKKASLLNFIVSDGVTDLNWRHIMVNLSAEMAKKSKKQ